MWKLGGETGHEEAPRSGGAHASSRLLLGAAAVALRSKVSGLHGWFGARRCRPGSPSEGAEASPCRHGDAVVGTQGVGGVSSQPIPEGCLSLGKLSISPSLKFLISQIGVCPQGWAAPLGPVTLSQMPRAPPAVGRCTTVDDSVRARVSPGLFFSNANPALVSATALAKEAELACALGKPSHLWFPVEGHT